MLVFGNVYSFGRTAGFFGGRSTMSIEDFVDYFSLLNLDGIELPFDKYIRAGEGDKIIALKGKLEGREHFVSLENYSLDYVMFLFDYGILMEGDVFRVKLCNFYGGNRSWNLKNYHDGLLKFKCFMDESIVFLTERRLKVLVENHQDLSFLDLDLLLKEYTPVIGLVWDTGNTLTTGLTLNRFVDKYRDHIGHVHLKDYCLESTNKGINLHRCVLGKGFVDFGLIFRNLDSRVSYSIELGAVTPREMYYKVDSWWENMGKNNSQIMHEYLDSLSLSSSINLGPEKTEFEEFKLSLDFIKKWRNF
jgi:sugar phosphate isomerase/epimerase